MAMVRRSFAQKRLGRSIHFSGLSRLRFRRDSSALTLKFRSPVSGNGKDVTVSPSRKISTQQHSFKTIVPARISRRVTAGKAKAAGSANRRTTELVWYTLL